MDDKKAKILDFLKSQKLGVVSSINKENKPESAVVAISETDKLELIFGTSNKTRKYQNIKANSKVSCVIYSYENKTTIQYEGDATEIAKDSDKYISIHTTKNPNSKKFVNDKDQTFFKITPKWIRYSNFSVKPEEIFEITF